MSLQTTADSGIFGVLDLECFFSLFSVFFWFPAPRTLWTSQEFDRVLEVNGIRGSSVELAKALGSEVNVIGLLLQRPEERTVSWQIKRGGSKNLPDFDGRFAIGVVCWVNVLSGVNAH